MTLLVDYSRARPSPASIKAAGYAGVMRYLSGGPNVKNLMPAEAKPLLAAGLSIGLVWETTANRASAGRTAGAYDAGLAEARADALGYPSTAVIFYAVDFDAAPSAVAPYFDGVMSSAKRPVGVYGGIRVVEAMHARAVPYMWQTAAWSTVGGVRQVSKIAHLYQRIHASVPHPISGTDENVVMHPFPMWSHAKAQPLPVPAPGTVVASMQKHVRVVPTDGKWSYDLDRAVNSVRCATFSDYTGNKWPYGVQFVQKCVGAVQDDSAGPDTNRRLVETVKALQGDLSAVPDGSWGKATEAKWQSFRLAEK
jgi:hypothetical protein